MTGFDLAIYDQAIWLYSRFKVPIVTVRGLNILGDHFSPILILIAPVFWIFEDARVLLVLQAQIVSLSAFFIFKTLIQLLKNQRDAFILSLSFFFFLGLQYALDYDFHLISIAVLPISLIFYGLFLNKMFPYWLGIVIAFGLKEDLPILISFISLYEFVILKMKRLGLLTMVLAIGYFFLEIKVIMPLFQINGEIKNYLDFYGLGGTLGEMVKNSITQPWLVVREMFNSSDKIRTFILSQVPFAFLPLFSPLFWFSSLPIWMERFLSYTSTRWQFEQYYGISLTPILVLSSAQVILFLRKKLSKIGFRRAEISLVLCTIVLVCSIVTNIVAHSPLTRLWHREYYQQTEAEKSMEEVVKLIPPGKSVSAQLPLISHLSHREQLFLFPKNRGITEFVAIVQGRPTGLISEEDLNIFLNQLIENDEQKMLYHQNGVYLFQRKTQTE